ncbi:MAG: AAA family ATPase [Clostridiales bacterium]|nr:AAA family ATPase [Clostridiales bacterium]
MDIRLKSIHLENFKCHKSLTITLDGRNASIYGDNATGKTSVYDALTWLLFGKDSAGNGEKNIEIKPLAPDGSVKDHQAITEVEAVLLADGEEICLKRTYKEAWSTKRGSSEATYDGNTSEYYVDGVPCKANAYKAKVTELVDEEQFRLLTTVSYFPDKLPWQKRREALFSLFGALDDRQIMETDQRFAPLMEAMGKLPLEDFKKVVTQKRKGFMATRNEVPARISECEKTISDLSGMDFDGAEAQLSILNARRESLNAELLAIQQNTAVQRKEIELKKAKLDVEAIERDNANFRHAQESAAPSAAGLEAELRRSMASLDSAKRSLDMHLLQIKRCDEQISTVRERWKQIKAEEYTGSDTCPTCGQRLPEDQIAYAIQRFTEDKKRRMDELVKLSDGYKTDLGRAKELEGIQRRYIREIEPNIQEIEEQIRKAKEAKTVISDMPDYAEKKSAALAAVTAIGAELTKLREDAASAASGLKSRMSEVTAEIDRVSGIAGLRSSYEYAQRRIQELREDAQAAAENLSQLDRLLYLMEEFSRYKASFVENGINDKFRIARFRLFREQANGGVEDRCDVVYDGVPYIGLNNGMKINVGIDIINTLSRAYGVTVPLFVDNAESVTNLEKTDCQVVRLVVSESDKELRIQHG